MHLDQYLLHMFVEEKEIIEQLLVIDNTILKTHWTYSDLLEKIRNCPLSSRSIEGMYNVITDGDPDTVYMLLRSFAPHIHKMHIHRNFVGINKWLVARTKDYYQEHRVDLDLILDIEFGYDTYLNESYPILLSGYTEFVEESKLLLQDKKIVTIVKEKL